MDDKYNKVYNYLEKYNQEHLLHFYEELDDQEKEILLNQLLRIDLDQIINIYNNSFKNSDTYSLSPLKHYEKERFTEEQINRYISIGESIITSNSFAVVTMAGGQGTRLRI